MAQGYVQLPDDAANAGKKEDHFITAIAGQYRESVVVADPSTDAAVAKVGNAAPGSSDYGLTTRDVAAAVLAGQTADYNDGASTSITAMVGIATPSPTGPVGVSSVNPLPTNQAPLTAITPATAAVTATSSQAVAANTSRKKATITNYGANDVCLAYGFTAVFGSGDYLLAGGGSAQITTTQAVNAICNTALTSNLAVQEWQ